MTQSSPEQYAVEQPSILDRHLIRRTAAAIAVGMSTALVLGGCVSDREPSGPYAAEEYNDIPRATEEILHRFDSCRATVDLDANPTYPDALSYKIPALPTRIVLELGRNPYAIPYLSHFAEKDSLIWTHTFTPVIQAPERLKRKLLFMPSPDDPKHGHPVLEYDFQERPELAKTEAMDKVTLPITAFVPVGGEEVTMSLQVRNTVKSEEGVQDSTLYCGTATLDSEAHWSVVPAK